MNKEDLLAYKEKLSKLSEEEQRERDLYLRRLALGEIQGPSVGYASIDKPWLKYYKEENILSDKPKDMTIYEYLQERNKNNLDRTAINFLGVKTSYRQLFEQIDKTAYALSKLGVKSGDIVTLYLPALPEECMFLYALDKIGACANFLFPNTPNGYLCDLSNKLNSKLLIVFRDFLNEEEYIYNNSCIENIAVINSNIYKTERDTIDDRTIDWSKYFQMLNYSKKIEFGRKNPSTPIFIAKTGGTTGVPKNVLLSDNSFNLVVHQYLQSSLDLNKGDRWLRLWPIFSATAAVSSNHLPLCAGMELMINPYVPVEYFDRVLIKDKPNHIPLAPVYLDYLYNSKLLSGQNFSFLKTVGFGGMGMSIELENKILKLFDKYNFQTFLGCGYGLTENASTCAIRMSSETSKIGTVGVPMVNNIVSVFNTDTLEEVGYDEEGEICILSDTAMIGYYDDEEATKKLLVCHSDGKNWIHTGDLGKIDKDGSIRVIGRIKKVIFIYPSDKVYPLNVEELIYKIDGVMQTRVIGIPDEEHEGFSIPICFVVANENVDSDKLKKDILEFSENSLPKYSKLRDVYVIDKMPLTSMNKIDDKKLKEKVLKKQKY